MHSMQVVCCTVIKFILKCYQNLILLFGSIIKNISTKLHFICTSKIKLMLSISIHIFSHPEIGLHQPLLKAKISSFSLLICSCL